MRFVIKFFVLIAAIYCFSGFAAGEAMAKSTHWKPQEKHDKHWKQERHDTRWDRSRRGHYVRRPEHRSRSYYYMPKSHHRYERSWRRR